MKITHEDRKQEEISEIVVTGSETTLPEPRASDTPSKPPSQEWPPTSTQESNNQDEPTSTIPGEGTYSSLRGMVYRKWDEIWMINAAAQEEYLFTMPDGWAHNWVELSPDGTAWFYRVGKGLEVFEAAAFGKSASNFYDVSWSPDGTKLAGLIDLAERWDYAALAIFDLETKQSKILDSYRPQCEEGSILLWSPDGEWITLRENCPVGGVESPLLLFEIDGQESIDINQMFDPVWRDANTLVYPRDGELWLFHLDEKRDEQIPGLEGDAILGWIPSQ